MKQLRLFITLLFLGIIGINSVWGEDMTIDFESATSTYTDWTFNNMTSEQTTIKAHGGSKHGTTGGKEGAYITTANKIANPSSITFYVSKSTTNTTSSNWKVQVSSTGNSWTDVCTQSATSMTKGSWVEVTQSLTAYSNVYVRVNYSGSTALRCIDDLTLTTGTSANPEVAFNTNEISFGVVEQDATVEAKTINATIANASSATISLSGDGASAFAIDKTSITENSTITITPNTSVAGTYNATLTISTTGAKSATATISMVVEAPFEGSVITLSAADDADIKFVTGENSATGAVWANSSPLSDDHITLSGSVTSGTNYSYYDGSVVRFYTNNNLIITPATGVTIVKIEIVRQTSSGSNGGTINCSGLTASSENTTTNTNVFTGSATSAVTFTVRAQARFKEIKVYYTGTAQGKTLQSISVTGTPEEFWKGDTFNRNGMTVTANWNDDSTTDVTNNATFSKPDMSTAGEQTITVTYQGKTGTYNIDVKTIANTQETAYSVAKAIELYDAGKDLTAEVYVTGTVSQIVTAWSDQYNNITYSISADGTTSGNQFQLYRCKTNGAEVGDVVIAKGTLAKYSSTYELAANNTIVDIQKPVTKTITALTVSGTPTKTTYNVGDTFDPTGLTVTATYDNGDKEVITEGFTWDVYYKSSYGSTFTADDEYVGVKAIISETLKSSAYELQIGKDITVNLPVTLSSVVVSGTPSKTEYYTEEAFETAGLVVTGTYSDGTKATIAEGITWNVTPAKMAKTTTSVTVTATVDGIKSADYKVNVTVTENPNKVATIGTFEATSGSINEDISYEAFQGNAGTAPLIQNKCIRLYQNGGYITITGVKGVKIQSVKITTSDTYESTTVGYCADGNDAPTTGETVAKSSNYTISNLNNQSVSIYCLGTNKDTRLEIAAIEVTYTKSEIQAYPTKIELSGTYPTAFTQGDAFSHQGMTVTATYSDETSKDVTASATFSGYNMATVGDQTVTVSYTDAEETVTTTYSISLARLMQVAANGYETVDFTDVYSEVTGTKSSIVADYEGLSFDMVFATAEKSTTPTKYFASGSSVRAYTGNSITITGAENIAYVLVNYDSETENGKYVDDEAAITGLGTKTAIITFSKTCRFTSITVYYRAVKLAAVQDETYYATFSANKAVEFVDATVYTISVAGETMTFNEVASKQVPANNGVLIKTKSTTAVYIYIDSAGALENNLLKPGENGLTTGDNCKFYRLAYGDFSAKTDLGFYYGSGCENGEAFKCKAGTAYLAVPNGASAPARFLLASPQVATEIEDTPITEIATQTYKLMLNGRICIVRDNRIYDITGQLVKEQH